VFSFGPIVSHVIVEVKKEQGQWVRWLEWALIYVPGRRGSSWLWDGVKSRVKFTQSYEETVKKPLKHERCCRDWAT